MSIDADQLATLGLDLAVRVRDGADPDEAAVALMAELRAVPAADVRRLALVLAAMVDIDLPRSRILAWCDGVPPDHRRTTPPRQIRQRKGCPSEAAYRRHLRAGEECPTGECRPYMALVERERRARHPEWSQ